MLLALGADRARLLSNNPDKAEQLGLKPRARFVSFSLAGDSPILMLTAPIPATKRALDKAGLKLSDIDLIELNEAFAVQSLAVIKLLGANIEKVNVRQNRLRFDVAGILNQFRQFARRQQLGVGEELYRFHSIP